MPSIYKYKRTHVYYYEVTANNLKDAQKALQKVWAGNYTGLDLSDYVLVKTTAVQAPKPFPAETVQPQEETVKAKPQPKLKKTPTVKAKPEKKPVKKTAKKKAAKKTKK